MKRGVLANRRWCVCTGPFAAGLQGEGLAENPEQREVLVALEACGQEHQEFVSVLLLFVCDCRGIAR